LGLPLKAEFPAGASANRAAIPAPNQSVLPKIMVQSEGGQVLTNRKNKGAGGEGREQGAGSREQGAGRKCHLLQIENCKMQNVRKRKQGGNFRIS
jgi:hypothetical protein